MNRYKTSTHSDLIKANTDGGNKPNPTKPNPNKQKRDQQTEWKHPQTATKAVGWPGVDTTPPPPEKTETVNKHTKTSK